MAMMSDRIWQEGRDRRDSELAMGEMPERSSVLSRPACPSAFPLQHNMAWNAFRNSLPGRNRVAARERAADRRRPRDRQRRHGPRARHESGSACDDIRVDGRRIKIAERHATFC